MPVASTRKKTTLNAREIRSSTASTCWRGSIVLNVDFLTFFVNNRALLDVALVSAISSTFFKSTLSRISVLYSTVYMTPE